MSSNEGYGDYQIENDPETQEKITNAVLQVLQEARGWMGTRVIVIAEVIQDDGRRAMWTSASPGMATWDERGMLGHALDKVSHFDLLSRFAKADFGDDGESSD